jgi:hypothetical protein
MMTKTPVDGGRENHYSQEKIKLEHSQKSGVALPSFRELEQRVIQKRISVEKVAYAQILAAGFDSLQPIQPSQGRSDTQSHVRSYNFVSLDEPRTCSNCRATKTPSWRRHPETNSFLCNACGLYLRLHNRRRLFRQTSSGTRAYHPLQLLEGSSMGRSCMNCGARGLVEWRGDGGLCGACALFEKTHGRARPGPSMVPNNEKPQL